jgi:hypothetical protein
MSALDVVLNEINTPFLKSILFTHLLPGLLVGDFPSACPNKFYINFAVS